MWSKAPAVKEKPDKGKAAASKAQTAPAVDADAALRSAQQVSPPFCSNIGSIAIIAIAQAIPHLR